MYLKKNFLVCEENNFFKLQFGSSWRGIQGYWSTSQSPEAINGGKQ